MNTLKMNHRFFLSFLLLFLLSAKSLAYTFPVTDSIINRFSTRIDLSGPVIWNMADNMNMWGYADGWQNWHGIMEGEAEDYFSKQFPYVRYIQLMTAAGGSEDRDLFKDPLDRSVMDDYDFSPLVRACKNIVRQGLVPHLKLGNVPLKFSKNPRISKDFGVNVCPPDDYHQWHAYIKALVRSIVSEFGLKNVRGWRFGVVTEYENGSWFSVDDDPDKTRDAYFTLYDYTVDAVEQVLGKNICIGAHSMTVSDGLWDERQFITHCAKGKNRCTGKIGTRLSFLAASYYDTSPGVESTRSLAETIGLLRETAEKEGFKDLFYGIDEGRILSGLDGKPLIPRAIGQTWQAAYDARLYHRMLDLNIDYFSHWSYTSSGIDTGAPSVSAHTSGLFYKMAGSTRLPVKCEAENKKEGEEIGAIAGFDKERKKLYLLFYAYSDSVLHSGERPISCSVSGIESKIKRVNAVKTLISDDTNFFDEWQADCRLMGLTADDFPWSADGYVIKIPTVRTMEQVEAFRKKLPYYQSCAELKPEQDTLIIENGVLNLCTNIPLHGVLLYEINVR
ncbi:MAG: hypothetical protein LBV43_06585 [Prevotella sp.]|nr:hypothetical protein [Prevotella sp.]